MTSTTLAPAAQVIVSLIPLTGIVLTTILIFFALLWHHHETKMLILKGLYTQKKFNMKAFSLLSGLCLIGTGLVLTVLFALLTGLSWALLSGLLPLAIGIALTLFSFINKE
ncbi:MAG: hypothetical protein IJ828_09155 [Treponema sp.]|nr:hypothetical protein [Treponema sp.]